MSTRQVLSRATKTMRTVKQEPMFEAMPADYNPNEAEEEEYRPLLPNKRKRGGKDTNPTALRDSKKARKTQEMVKETNAARGAAQKPTNDEKETSPTEEILASSHMCVLGCGEEVEGVDEATHYAIHYLQEGMRASLFVHPVLGHLRYDDLEALELTYKTSILESTEKKYQCLESKTCTSRKMMFREFAVHNLTERNHCQLEKLLKRDSRSGLDKVLERLYPSPQVKAREESKRREKEARKLAKVKEEKQETIRNEAEMQGNAPEVALKGPQLKPKDSMKVKVKKETVEVAVDFELEESCNEEDVDNPREDNEAAVIKSRPSAVGSASPPPELGRMSNAPLVATKEVPGRVEVVVRKDTTTTVENKLSRVEVVRKPESQVAARLPAAKEVVRRVAVDRVHNCVLCNDKDGRSMNLGSGLWDIKYHYAVSILNIDAV